MSKLKRVVYTVFVCTYTGGKFTAIFVPDLGQSSLKAPLHSEDLTDEQCDFSTNMKNPSRRRKEQTSRG